MFKKKNGVQLMNVKKIKSLLCSLITFICADYATAAEDDKNVYVIVGATGQTGSRVSKNLINQGLPVRVILRTEKDLKYWNELGAQTVIADVGDENSLKEAFRGARTAYLLNPPAYDHDNHFDRAKQVQGAMIKAANESNIKNVVALSSVGAQHTSGTGNILTGNYFEQQLKSYRGNLTILRPANFIENWVWSFEPVLKESILPSMFLPIDRSLPMVSIDDIATTVTDCLIQENPGTRIIELHGPEEYSPNDAAKALSTILGKPVQAKAVPEENWSKIFEDQKFPKISVDSFCEMYRGFNSGHTSFEGTHETRHGKVTLEEALRKSLESSKRH